MYDHYLTVGELKKVIADLPDDTPVFTQRVEDAYFQPGKGWKENVRLEPDFHGITEEYMRAFCAFRSQDGKAVLITPHY